MKRKEQVISIKTIFESVERVLTLPYLVYLSIRKCFEVI